MIENFIIEYGYIALFIILFTNGILSMAFNSSQITFIIAGYFIYTGHLNLGLVILLGTIARTLGNISIYEIVRKYGLPNWIKTMFRLNDKVLKKLEKAFKQKGAKFIFIGKLIAATNFITVLVCGLAKTNRFIYVSIMAITNLIWACAFISLGYSFGKSFSFGIIYSIIMLTFTAIFLYFASKYIGFEKKDFY